MTEGRTDDSAPTPPAPAAAAEARAETRAPAATAKGSRAASWLAALLVLALALVAGAPYWAPRLLPLLPWGPRVAANPPALAALEARLAASDQRIAQLDAALQSARAASAEPALSQRAEALSQRLDALFQRLDALERRPEVPPIDAAALTAPLQDEIHRLEARLDEIEARLGRLAQAQSSAAEADRMLLVAVAELRAAVAEGRPYVAELAAATALGQGRAEVEAALKPLADAAATGLPGTALLAERFRSETAPAILRAASASVPADAGWEERILARLSALVIVRRVDEAGEPSGDPVAAAVARAEAALRTGDLAGAVAALDPLSGAAAQAASAWRDAARRSVTAEAALAGLQQSVARRLAAPEEKG